MTNDTQKQFWDLVDKGAVKVKCKQACIDALNDTPNIDLDEFLAEAKDHQWIGDILVGNPPYEIEQNKA